MSILPPEIKSYIALPAVYTPTSFQCSATDDNATSKNSGNWKMIVWTILPCAEVPRDLDIIPLPPGHFYIKNKYDC